MNIPEFVNREKEIKEVKAILSGRPNFVYFVYGPINSGKTALLMKVSREIPENYVVFYINFRWRNVEDVEDLIRVLFRVKRGGISEEVTEIVKEFLKAGAKVVSKFLSGIPISERLFDVLFRRKDKMEDIFAFLDEYFEKVREEGYKVVFILDEMQTIKDVINSTGNPVMSSLFNFLVGLTKERHLCHCLCATSDCLFIEDIYSNARLEGRAKYLLVDDLNKEKAYRVYEEFGFEKRELIWQYIGGKIGDIVGLFEGKKRGYDEKETIEMMLKDVKNRMIWIFDLVEENGKKELKEDIKQILIKFKDREVLPYKEVKGKVLKFLIQENILFYNPVEGIVRPQSRLIWHAIREIYSEV